MIESLELSQIKMVVTDMDGTLLNSNHEVSNRFFEIFELLQAKGIHFVAASGRQYHSMADKLEKIKNEIIFISENGAFIKKGNKELSVTPLKQGIIEQLLDIVDSIDGAYAMLCGKYKSYFNRNSMAFLDQLKEYYSNYEVVKDFSMVTDEIVKIAVYHGISAEEFIYPKTQHLNNQVKVKVSGQNWMDLNHIDAHKGNALQKVMDACNLSANEIMAFGDYNNDLEMLSLVKYSFAMENAHPDIKKVANFQTESNDANGVEKILEKLI